MFVLLFCFCNVDDLEDAPSLVFVDDLNEQKAAEHWRKKYNEQLEKWVSTSCLTN